MRLNTSVVCAAAGLVFVTLSASCKESSDKNKREVVLYCSVDQEVAEQIIPEFEKETGIRVLARFDTEASKTTGLIQRIRSEAASPVADVFWSSEIFYTIRLADESLLAPHHSERTRGWPGKFADRAGRWYAFGLRARVIAYNTNRVTAQESPKTLEDALEAKWKGRLVMADPGFGTTGPDVASWFVHYGRDRAIQVLQRLKANEVRLVEGNSTAVRMVATGQADICFTDSDDVYAAQRNDWPVAMNYLDQAGDGPLAIPNTAAMIRDGPHPAEAAALMDFLLSEKLERMLAQTDSHNTPIHPAVAAQFQAYAIGKTLDIDYARIAQWLPTAVKIARETLK